MVQGSLFNNLGFSNLNFGVFQFNLVMFVVVQVMLSGQGGWGFVGLVSQGNNFLVVGIVITVIINNITGGETFSQVSV